MTTEVRSESDVPSGLDGARGYVLVALAWSVLAIVLIAVQAAGSESPRLFDGWVQFDGPEYVSIVEHGYQLRQLVWFPLLPMLMEVIGWVVPDVRTAGVIASSLGGLASALLFWRWTADHELTYPERLTGISVMLLYPYGWFLYGVLYPDALFLAAAVAAFVLAERDRLWLAALAGALATAARPSGFAVVVGLVVLTLQRRGVIGVDPSGRGWTAELAIPTRSDPERLDARTLVPLLSLGGLVAYMAYQWVAWGSPLRFFSEQARYHESGISSLLKQQYFEAWSQGFDGRHLATTTFQAVLLVVVIASVPAVGRRFGWGYGAYVFCLALLPLISVSTFMGVGRYLLPAFPCFALAGEWLSRRPAARALWLLGSGAALGVMAFGFSRSWYLS